jgi:hypothetical protein
MKTQNTQEMLKATGHLKIDHFNSKGTLIDSRFIPNLVVQVGKNYIASRMIGTSAGVMTHMEVGTGNTAPVTGDTTLQAAVGGSRVVFSSAASTSTNTVSYAASFAPGVGTGALTEAGIFNASSAGTMLCRTTFAVVNKAAGDTINISWSVNIA